MAENVAAPESTGEAAPLTNNVEAPAAAPQTTPEAPAAPAITAEDVAKFLGTTPETLADYQKYMDNNGGFDKTFANTKKALSGRTPAAEAANQAQMQAQAQVPTPSPVNDFPPAPKVTVDGGFTAQEFMVQQYFQSLGQKEEYASIADEIRSGEVLKVMRQFNIEPMIGDQFNNKQVTAFLDMYSKTKPAPTPEAPVTSTPTAEFSQIENDTISSMEQAMLVLSEDRKAKAAGREGHPLATQATEFFNKTLSANQNRGRRDHSVLKSE